MAVASCGRWLTRLMTAQGFGSKLGERVQNTLKYCFPVPK